MSRRGHRSVTLPSRQGVSASSVALVPGTWATVLDFLKVRLPDLPEGEWLRRLQQGDVLTPNGETVGPDTAYAICQQQHAKLHYWRSVPGELPIPFDATVVFQDEFIVVADKPHFLPVAPTGAYVKETLLVRLKQQLGIDTLAPMHRLDRETAGLVAFTVQPQTRHAYQTLFKERLVDKTYHAVAPWSESHVWPKHHASHLREGDHFMTVMESSGPINAETHIQLLDHCPQRQWGLYQLKPLTGQRHQLRVHMMSLGLPLMNDRIYPVLQAEWKAEQTVHMSEAVRHDVLYSHPLQLLAHSLSFKDPVNGQPRQFESQRRLACWEQVKSQRDQAR
jgi:tRNA pseudouridine32 synthase / 23S rRNA pseudouridine746 synthase